MPTPSSRLHRQLFQGMYWQNRRWIRSRRHLGAGRLLHLEGVLQREADFGSFCDKGCGDGCGHHRFTSGIAIGIGVNSRRCGQGINAITAVTEGFHLHRHIIHWS